MRSVAPGALAAHFYDRADRRKPRRTGRRPHPRGNRIIIEVHGLPAGVAHQKDAVVQAIWVGIGDIGIGAFDPAREICAHKQIENTVDAVGSDPAPLRFGDGFGNVIGRRRLGKPGERIKNLRAHRGPLLARPFQCPAGGIGQRLARMFVVMMLAHADRLKPGGGAQQASVRRPPVKVMAKRQQPDANQREHRLASTFMRQRYRPSHYPQPHRTKRCRHHIPMRHRAAHHRHRAKHNRQGQANFVNDRVQQQAPRRCRQRNQHRTGHAMHHAQARKADCPLVQPQACKDRLLGVGHCFHDPRFHSFCGKLQYIISGASDAGRNERDDVGGATGYGAVMLMRSTLQTRADPKLLMRWLFAVAALVILMVAVGGITRLTESGLSITRWKPISGVIPPLSQADWQTEFDHYKQIPEYQQLNRAMTLAGFKAIFFWEYAHRLLGRVIGLAFAVPLFWFAMRRQIPVGYGWRLGALLALGGLQGAIGWWMVASGLAVRTDVSHVRLAVHLMTALVLLSGIVWTALDLRALAAFPLARAARLRPVAGTALALLMVQIMFGAFTAGLDAGYAFSSWPLMGGTLFPADAPMMAPAWRNAVDNPIVVQFIHRWFAFAAAAGLAVLAWRAAKIGARRAAMAIAVLVTLQISLGIATLLSGVAITIAVAHQVNSAVLLVAAVTAAHTLGRRQHAA